MTRSKLNFDIGADEAPEISAEDIRRATAASGFGGEDKPSEKHPVIYETRSNASEIPRRGRPRTGRVHQFNMRVRAETIQAVQDYADRNGIRTMVEVIEMAVDALLREEKLSSSQKD